MNRLILRGSALLGLAAALSACRARSAPDAQVAAWSLLTAAPDSVLLDTARIEWASADARVWLRVAAVESRHEVNCARSEVRDLEIPLRDSVPASAHPALQPLLPTLCARLAQLNPRGLHNLLGSDRP